MENLLTITGRELKEIQHALYYDYHLMHGTVGHNMLALIAKLANAQGFGLNTDNVSVIVPKDVIVERGK